MKKLFRNLHIYLSLFFLPLALMYALTGTLYVIGFNQDSGADKRIYHVERPVSLQKGGEKEFLLRFLAERNLKIPSDLSPKTQKGTFTLGSASYEVSLTQNADSTLTVTTTRRSVIGNMILLHKAKAKWYFDVLAIGFGFTLVVLYLSGLTITLFGSRKNRNAQILTFLAGAVVSGAIGILSVL